MIDLWGGFSNQDYLKVSLINIVTRTCHDIRTPNYTVAFDNEKYSSTATRTNTGYNGEMVLSLTKNTSTDVWGYIHIPITGSSESSTILSSNNALQSSKIMNTMNMEYATPVVQYENTLGIKHFFLMSYISDTSTLTGTTSFQCISPVQPKDITNMTWSNCWDLAINPGYETYVLFVYINNLLDKHWY